MKEFLYKIRTLEGESRREYIKEMAMSVIFISIAIPIFAIVGYFMLLAVDKKISNDFNTNNPQDERSSSPSMRGSNYE